MKPSILFILGLCSPVFASEFSATPQKVLVNRYIADKLYEAWLVTGTYKGHTGRFGLTGEPCYIKISAGDPTDTSRKFAYQKYSIKLGHPEWIKAMYEKRPLIPGNSDPYEADVWYSSQSHEVGPYPINDSRIELEHIIKGVRYDGVLTLTLKVNKAWEPTAAKVSSRSLAFDRRLGACKNLRRVN